jgi:tetratricopeptide (TPR) repeat protein
MAQESNQELGTQDIPVVGSPIAEAWVLLERDRPDEAIAAFDSVIQQEPNNVDARYGKGLALRAAGKSDAAVEEFQKTLQLSRKLLEEVRSQYGVSDSVSSLETTEDDRYMMLDRMIRQRLAELGAKTE